MKKVATLIICACLALCVTTCTAHARSIEYGMAQSYQVKNPTPEFGEKPTMEMFGKVMQAHREKANNPDIFITGFKPDTAVCTARPIVKDNGLIATGWIVDYDLHVNGEKQQWYAVFFNNKLVVCQEDSYNKVRNNSANIDKLHAGGISIKDAVSYYNDAAGIMWVNQSEAMTNEHFIAWQNSLPKE